MMAFYKDFTVCRYFDTEQWMCRLMAVGWIEHGNAFPKGPTNARLVERIGELRGEFYEAFPSISFRGLHVCTICTPDGGGDFLGQSHINLFIPHRGFVFVAPGRVDHYIQSHQYLPPESFMDAVLACPSPLSAEYRDAIRASNRGVEAPLFESH